MRFLADNWRLGLFLGGALVCYGGLASLSGALANVIAGVVCMTVAAWPYLSRMRKG
jgi:hypothetical protein